MEKKCQYFVMKIAALVFRRSLEIRFQFLNWQLFTKMDWCDDALVFCIETCLKLVMLIGNQEYFSDTFGMRDTTVMWQSCYRNNTELSERAAIFWDSAYGTNYWRGIVTVSTRNFVPSIFTTLIWAQESHITYKLWMCYCTYTRS